MATKHQGQATIAEAAKFLRVSQETVRRYIRDEKLNAAKKKSVGLRRVWMIDWDVLEQFDAE